MTLPDGVYRGRPMVTTLGYSRSGKEQIAVSFDVVDPQTRITWWGYFSDGAFPRTIESLRACGWTGNDLTDFAGDMPPPGFDKEVELVIRTETYEGKTRQRVAFINSLDRPRAIQGAAMSPADRAAFSARMKGKIVALAAKAKSDEDIPF